MDKLLSQWVCDGPNGLVEFRDSVRYEPSLKAAEEESKKESIEGTQWR